MKENLKAAVENDVVTRRLREAEAAWVKLQAEDSYVCQRDERLSRASAAQLNADNGVEIDLAEAEFPLTLEEGEVNTTHIASDPPKYPMREPLN